MCTMYRGGGRRLRLGGKEARMIGVYVLGDLRYFWGRRYLNSAATSLSIILGESIFAALRSIVNTASTHQMSWGISVTGSKILYRLTRWASWMIYILGTKQFLLCTSVMKEVQYAYGHANYFMEAYASLLLTTEAHQHTATLEAISPSHILCLPSPHYHHVCYIHMYTTRLIHCIGTLSASNRHALELTHVVAASLAIAALPAWNNLLCNRMISNLQTILLCCTWNK